jgi:hypothetical protein
MGPVDEGSGPNHHHPQYGEARYGGMTRPVRGGGTIDGRDIEHRASYCLNLAASGESDGRLSGGTTDGRDIEHRASYCMNLNAAGESDGRVSGGGCEKKLAASGESDDRDIGGGETTTNGRIDPGMVEDWNSNRKRVNSQVATIYLTETPFCKEKRNVNLISRATVQSSGRDAARGSGGGTDCKADRAPIVDGTAGEPRGEG